MKKFVTIKYFTDLQDNGHAYHGGDIFPREGLEVSDERIKELSTDANRRSEPLIKAVEDPVEDIPEKTTEEAKEEPQEIETDESPVEEPKAKRKPRKSHVRTDS